MNDGENGHAEGLGGKRQDHLHRRGSAPQPAGMRLEPLRERAFPRLADAPFTPADNKPDERCKTDGHRNQQADDRHDQRGEAGTTKAPDRDRQPDAEGDNDPIKLALKLSRDRNWATFVKHLISADIVSGAFSRVP